jgi:hypothetical protein
VLFAFFDSINEPCTSDFDFSSSQNLKRFTLLLSLLLLVLSCSASLAQDVFLPATNVTTANPQTDSLFHNIVPPVELLPSQPIVDQTDEDVIAQPTRPRRAGPGGGQAPVRWNLGWALDSDASNVPGSLSYTTSDLRVGYPISISDSGMTLLTGGVQWTGIDSQIVLPDSNQLLPSELWNIELGLMRTQQLENDRELGGLISIGSPSDQPFASIREMTLTTMLFYNIPSGESNSWNFSLFYSPTGQMNFPVPGVAYAWRPNDRFEMNLGIPFSLRYQPDDQTTITVRYLPLVNFQFNWERQLNDQWTITAGYRVVNEIYLLADRIDEQERLNLFDQRAHLGLRRRLPAGWQLEVGVSYLFDRQIFQSPSFGDDRTDQIDIEPGLLSMLQLSWQR